MNITQALNTALPDLPAKQISERHPRMPPNVVFKEHIVEGQPVIKAFIPGTDAMYSFPPASWALIELFDGQRSYEEIAKLYSEKSGEYYSAEIVRNFAADVDAMNFWYKTPQEKNVKLMMKTAEQRRKLLKQKSRWGDLSMIKFPAINPDRFLTWLYRYLSFVYTWWFTALTFLGLAFTVWIFITHWSEIGRDTLRFYNFADKTWFDVAVFWIAGSVLLCIHEVGHGFTCKHYGARVPAMGFLLIYLTPAFYTDTTEGEVLGDRYQRLMITVSGVWSELIICAIATPIWWGTPPGTALHDFAYMIILFTGIAVVLINWNPLIKLDGYYILTELLGIPDLKEESTLYLSGWVKKNIWHLPVEVPYVPKRRRVGFAVYAVLSGLYSYSVLYVFASFIGNMFRNFTHDWAFVFEYGTAFLIFRGRLRTLGNFMKLVYLDKKDRIRRWFTGRHSALVAVSALILLVVPVWHESATGRFVLEPDHLVSLRAKVAGLVTDVTADEGQQVSPGATLIRLQNLQVESRLARSDASRDLATARRNAAVLHYANVGGTERERTRSAEEARLALAEKSELQLSSPISGTVLSPNVKDMVGTFVAAGTELAQVGDLSRLRARIYVSEYDIRRFRTDRPARLQVDGMFGTRAVESIRISPVPSDIAPNLVDLSQFSGMRPPNFYVVDLIVPNSDGRLAPGMIGTARLYGDRRSIAGFALRGMFDFVSRKVW